MATLEISISCLSTTPSGAAAEFRETSGVFQRDRRQDQIEDLRCDRCGELVSVRIPSTRTLLMKRLAGLVLAIAAAAYATYVFSNMETGTISGFEALLVFSALFAVIGVFFGVSRLFAHETKLGLEVVLDDSHRVPESGLRRYRVGRARPGRVPEIDAPEAVAETKTVDDEVRRGGFGEPYCSEACYEEAGRAMATARLRGEAGDCAYCGRTVGSRHLILASREGLVFFCESCADRVGPEVRSRATCYMCQKAL